ncbi:hypothetical protein GCM10009555_029520 [Acrocarpospora macrocephala]|uniref:Uncharacterized protein n=1 Tax=Acrocarpospora macrocephala TaxID=150177 RepID=A0A5M3WV11_9ACTN|nr:hypothetical protein Amac_047380 [Acrocarpospora macrocephala]
MNGTGRPPKEQYLWRVRGPAQTNNNARAGMRCNRLWPGYLIVNHECDEYPFASAGNRSDASDKERNFSVCAMPGGAAGPNQTAGRALTRLYNKTGSCTGGTTTGVISQLQRRTAWNFNI